MSDETFEGFVPPTKNYFPMPNEWIDICARIDNLAELKVIQYVLRHTWGFREYGIMKTISVDEFIHGRKRHDGTRMDNGTGLKSDRSVKDGIKAAIKHGYLIFEVDTSDPARTRKSYALKMIGTGVDTTPQVDTTPVNGENTGVDTTPLTGRYYPPEGYNLPPWGVVSTPRTEKDTLERHLEKNTSERQESSAGSSEPAAPASSSQSDSHSHADYMKLPARATPIPFAEQAKAISEKRQTDPALPAVKPSKHTPTPQSQVSRTPDVAPPASVGATAQAGAGQDMPAMALTAKQIKQQNERRAKEIWAIIERELGTTFTQTQRKSDFNTKGMQNLIEDQISDEQLSTALSKLDDFGIKNFNLKRFHEIMPGLLSRRKAPNGKPASRDEPESFVSKTLDVERNNRRIDDAIEKARQIRAERQARAI